MTAAMFAFEEVAYKAGEVSSAGAYRTTCDPLQTMVSVAHIVATF
jgi:hypothetical protein